MSPTSLPESFNTQAENPYVAAKREWNERYGSYIHQARMWQIMAFLSSGWRRSARATRSGSGRTRPTSPM